MEKENFYYNDKFYHELCSLMEDENIKQEDLQALPDDWSVKVEECELQQMFELTAHKLSETLANEHEDRYDEDGSQSEDIVKALEECVNFDKLNSMIPSLWYPNGNFFYITKNDLVKYCN